MQDYLAAAALVASLVSILLTLFRNNSANVWKLSDRMNKMDTERAEIRRLLDQKIEDKFDEAVTQFGETLRAYAEHIRLLELEIYKNFVRRDTFDKTVEGITAQMNARFDKLERLVEEWRRS